MKLSITILTLLTSFQIHGQSDTFFKTSGNKNLHYIEFSGGNVKVYKMGKYFDNSGTAPAVLQTDTLIFIKENEFKGKSYSLFKSESNYILKSDNGKSYRTDPESEAKVNTELNNAYCIKSHIDLSHKLNKEFPLSHYTFRNGYSAWEKQPQKSVNHIEFIQRTDKEIAAIYDSISKKQKAFTKTTNFIIDNAKQTNYSILKDSISTLPIDWRPQNGYFDKSVYQMSKANPEYFYKLLQDFPTSKTFIYFAVDRDKALVKQLKKVQGYDDLKKEFVKDYNYGKTLPYRTLGITLVFAGLLTWLIIAQP